MPAKTTLGIVDDHYIFRRGLQAVLEKHFDDLLITLEASNGQELKEQLKIKNPPDILLLDIRMPVMNGWQTLEWLHKHFPELPVIILTVCETDVTCTRMIRYGARAILKKNTDPFEIRKAILHVKKDGYFYNDPFTRKLMVQMYKEDAQKHDLKVFLTEKEWQLLQLAATELSYKQIADEMEISERAVDKLRNKLFEKLGAPTRVALALIAEKHGLV